MEKTEVHDGWGETFTIITPYGKKLPAPAIECAETALFLRAAFASWYGLPFFVQARDRNGRLFLGHFGFRTTSGKYGNTPNFKSAYKDYSGSYSEGDEWPSDSRLRGRKLGGSQDDFQTFLGEDARAGTYFDEIFLNKRTPPRPDVQGRRADGHPGRGPLARGLAGLLLGGVPGVPSANVVVIGGGVVGENAVEMATGLGARVTVLDRKVEVLDALAARFGTAIETVYSTSVALQELVVDADLVVGAVLVKGDRAPKLVTADMVSAMRRGSVLVDVAIDQGGSMETSRPTTHSDPTYVVDGVVHYCVANMPGAVPRTSTYALNNSTLPFVIALADKGAKRALVEDAHLRNGLNVAGGEITEPAVASALGLNHLDVDQAVSRLPG